MPHSFQICRFKVLNSTNAEAKSGYSSGIYKSGAVIVAEHQLQGRGQLRTKWHDAPGENLLLSLVYEPDKLPARHFFRLNEAVSLAISDIIPDGIDTQVKWPNDIYTNGKKCAGILIETQIQNENINAAFIGIGLNVNQALFSANFKATSLKLESGESFDLEDLQNKLLEALFFRLQQIQLPELLSRVYKNRLLGVRQMLRYKDGQGFFQAQVHHIEEDGRLVLQVPGESTFRYYRFKEVKLLGA